MVMVAGACVEPPPPTDPLGFVVRLGTGSLDLSWQDLDPAHRYRVERITDAGWVHLADTTDASYSDISVVDGERYLYRVHAVVGGWSRVVSATYVVPVLPVVRVETEEGAPIVDRENYVRSTVSIDPNGSSFDAFTGAAGIRGRGNSTWAASKKPYKFKLDSKSELLGMAKEKDWVLLANVFDRSQLRNFAASELGAVTDLEWGPDNEWVELVLNGEYLGVYQLAEQVEVKPRRLDIAEMEADDISGEALTGGYLLELDQRLEQNSEPGFRTRRRAAVVIKEPDPAEPEQFNYIRNYVQEFEDRLYSPGFADPVAGYRSRVEVDSVIDWYIVQELMKNQDAMFSSSFFYKDRNELLRFGPLWDFDNSMGTIRGVVPPEPDGFHVNIPNRLWVQRFFADPTFVDRLDERWDSFKAEFDRLPGVLLTNGDALRSTIANDQHRWAYELQPSDQPQFLADWLTARLAWMDTQIDQLAAES